MACLSGIRGFATVLGLSTALGISGAGMPAWGAGTFGVQDSVAVDPDEVYALAAGHYERGQWEEAASGFQQFIRTNPQDTRVGAAWFFTGEALLQSGRLSSSRAAFQHYLLQKTHPEWKAKAEFRNAEIAARTNDSEAVRLLENCLSRYPQSEWREFALYYLGHRRLARGEPQLARRVLEKSLAEYPASALRGENLLGAGIAARTMGDLDAARGYFLQLHSEATGDLQMGAALQLAGIHVLQKAPGLAEPLLDPLIAKPELPAVFQGESWLLKGTCRAMAGDDREAIRCFLQSRKLARDADLLAVSTWQLAAAQLRLGEMDAAIEELQLLVEKWPEHRLAESAGPALVESAFQQELWESAVSFAERVEGFCQNPADRMRIAELKGRAEFQLDLHEACNGTFEKLLVDWPEAPPAARSVWLYFAGCSQMGLGQTAAAIDTFRLVDPSALELELVQSCRLALASALFTEQRFSEAAAELREVLAASGDPAKLRRARHELILILVQTADWTALDREIGAWWQSEEGSGRSAVLTRRVAELAIAGMPDLAARCFGWLKDNRSLTPDARAEAIAALGWMALDAGDSDGALELFEQLTEKYSDSAAASDCWIVMASLHEKRESWETASWLYGHAAERSEKESTRQAALFKQAVMLRRIGTPWSITRGGNILEQLAAEEPAGLPADELQYELAWFEQHRGQSRQSIERFQSIVAEMPSSPLWPDAALRVAQDAMDRSEDAEAGRILGEVVDLPSAPPEIAARASFLLGQLASRQDNWAETAACMKRAIALQPDRDTDLRCRFWLGESQFRLRQFPESLETFTTLQKSEAEFAPNIAPWIWLRSAQCQAQLENWPEVNNTLLASAGRFPDFPSAWEFEFLAGRERFAAGMFDDAIRKFEMVTRSPNAKGSETAAQSQWLIGEALFHQEKYREAVEAFYRVDSLYDSPKWRSAAFFQAGKCQEHLGNRKQAIALYSQLIQKFPDCQFVEGATHRLELLRQTASLSGPGASPATR